MTAITCTIHITRPAKEVFQYVTTPGHWPEWHPSSLGVSGQTHHSLDRGEQVTEEYRVAGWRGRALWVVRECDPPVRWVIEGKAERGGSATIIYTLAEHDGGTTFQRELRYEMPNFLLALLDRWLFRRRIQAESQQALRNLKKVLESRPAVGLPDGKHQS